jgi:hypothetical protein
MTSAQVRHMIYRKNIYRWEQIVLLAAGVALAIYGLEKRAQRRPHPACA